MFKCPQPFPSFFPLGWDLRALCPLSRDSQWERLREKSERPHLPQAGPAAADFNAVPQRDQGTQTRRATQQQLSGWK